MEENKKSKKKKKEYEPYIKRICSNMEKHCTYQELLKKRVESFNHENYIEVIAYSYAMIEDRLLSFLHHLYVVNREKLKLEDFVEPHLGKKMKKDYEKAHKYNPHIKNISTKIRIIKELCKYTGDDSILIKIHNHIKEVIDIEQLNTDIKDLEEWLFYRNEITHCLFNKNLEDLAEQEENIAKRGIRISEQFDYYSDLLKGNINNKESLRKKFERELNE